MEPLGIITGIGGIALLVALFGGGIKAKEIEIPPIPVSARILSGITGIILIGIAVRLSNPAALAPAVPSPVVSTATAQAPAVILQQEVSATLPPTQPNEQSTTPMIQPSDASTAPDQAAAASTAGELYFMEDFEDGKADDFRFFAEDWHVIGDGPDNKVLEAKTLGESPSAWTQADFGPVTLADYSIEYRVRLIDYDFSKGTASGSTSLKFRQGSPGSYIFALNPYEHRMELNHSASNGSWKPLDDGKGVRAYDFQKNVWYAIRIEMYGTQIQVFVDGKPVFSFEDPRLTEGGFAFLRAPDTIVQFDDVRVMK